MEIKLSFTNENVTSIIKTLSFCTNAVERSDVLDFKDYLENLTNSMNEDQRFHSPGLFCTWDSSMQVLTIKISDDLVDTSCNWIQAYVRRAIPVIQSAIGFLSMVRVTFDDLVNETKEMFKKYHRPRSYHVIRLEDNTYFNFVGFAVVEIIGEETRVRNIYWVCPPKKDIDFSIFNVIANAELEKIYGEDFYVYPAFINDGSSDYGIACMLAEGQASDEYRISKKGLFRRQGRCRYG